VDVPAHVSLRPNCGPWKLKDILVLWHCWRYEANSTLILLVSGNYCILDDFNGTFFSMFAWFCLEKCPEILKLSCPEIFFYCVQVCRFWRWSGSHYVRVRLGLQLFHEVCTLWVLFLRLTLSLHFNGHFPGERELAGVYWSKGWWRLWWQLDYWSYKSCKAPVKSSSSTNQHPVFLQAGCPSCRPTNSVKAVNGKISHSMDLLTPISPGSLWPLIAPGYLPWGRVAMPLISPLMLVPLLRLTLID